MKRASLALGLYRPARVIYRHVLNRGQLEHFRSGIEFYRTLLDPPCLCFDVGANVGEKTEAMLAAGASVVAFEPQVDCIEELRARCGRFPRLETRRAAVGARAGKSTFFVHKQRNLSSMSDGWGGEVESTATVDVTTLDDAIKEFGAPEYCKIDVEGWEMDVLKGLTRPIPLLSFEYHLIEGGAENALACLDHLAPMGQLSINLVPAEELSFSFDRWCSLDEFRRRFPEDFRRRDGYFYGDIFIRMS